MHEWALAEAVVVSAVKAAEAGGISEIKQITVKVGELQQIELDVFEFVLCDVLQSQTPAIKNAKIVLETEPASLKCRVCGCDWPFKEALAKLSGDEAESIHFIPEVAHVYIRCPDCSSPDFEFTAGRGIRIESIEGE